MSSDRKKPGVAFWAAVVLSLPVLYLLSFGPATWICSQGIENRDLLLSVYRPLVTIMSRDYSARFHNRKPDSMRGRTAKTIPLSDGLLGCYAELFMRENIHWFYFAESVDPKDEPHVVVQEKLLLGTATEANSLCTPW